VGQVGNQWNAGGQIQGLPSSYIYNPYGKNPYRQKPYRPNPSRQNQWGQPRTGWNSGAMSDLRPQMSFNPKLPFLATLELLNVSKLTNDPILHNPYWPPVPTKIPSDCPKFDGKAGEDPQAHVMTYHLWCKSMIQSSSMYFNGFSLALLPNGILSWLMERFRTLTCWLWHF